MYLGSYDPKENPKSILPILQVDIDNLVDIKFSFMLKGIQPSEIEKMPYWEYQKYFDKLKTLLEPRVEDELSMEGNDLDTFKFD